ATLFIASPLIGVVISGGLAFLLHQKKTLHRLVDRIGEKDFRAIMQFALISLVILPVLPDRAFGPWDTLNPFRSWLMVVLIVGLGLAGWVAFQLLGSRAGVLLGGILGGLVSSTATTVTFARRARDSKKPSLFAQLVILLASTVAFARVIVEVATVAPSVVLQAAPPIAIVLGTMMLLSAALYFFSTDAIVDLPEAENPAALDSALAFGAIYTIVTLASAAAQEWIGPRALYAVALVSGLADVDAITLSTAGMASRGTIPVPLAWRVILIASLANLAFKLGIVATIAPRLAPRIGVSFGVTGAVGLALILLWPDA
ncbi:MAG: MgtC/SapB family protein, partial [Candidatus Binatia bacterium]